MNKKHRLARETTERESGQQFRFCYKCKRDIEMPVSEYSHCDPESEADNE